MKNSVRENLLNEIYDNGPKIDDPLLDKYNDTITGYIGGRIDNGLVSLISSNIFDKKYALSIYNRCESNTPLLIIISRYFCYKIKPELIVNQLLKSIQYKIENNISPTLNPADFDINKKIDQDLLCTDPIYNVKFIRHNFPEIDNFRLDNERVRRQNFYAKYSWSVPNNIALDQIKEFCGNDNILEIGSGLGLWAHLIRLSGLNIFATDIGSTGTYYTNFSKTWTNVEIMNHKEAIHKYGSQCNLLFLSWPCHHNLSAFESINHYQGSKLIYIGEGLDGSTGEPQFFKLLKKKYKFVKSINIPRWAGNFDKLYCYVKNDID